MTQSQLKKDYKEFNNGWVGGVLGLGMIALVVVLSVFSCRQSPKPVYHMMQDTAYYVWDTTGHGYSLSSNNWSVNFINTPERFYPTRVCNMRWGVGGTWQIQVNGQWIDTTAGFHKVEDSFWKYCSIDTVSGGVSHCSNVTGFTPTCYTKHQVDSAYRAGIKKGRQEVHLNNAGTVIIGQ